MVRLRVSAIDDDTTMADCDGDTLMIFSYDGPSTKIKVDVNQNFAELSGSAGAMCVAAYALNVCTGKYLQLLNRIGALSAKSDERLIDYTLKEQDDED